MAEDRCPNLKYPVYANREVTDPSQWPELVAVGVIGPDFKPKTCGYDLTKARKDKPELTRCPECGRSLG